ncbi:MAG: hypothetical protein FWE52_03750 [Alphaproteobacteria bacterium]|nr:hypothetical protein [Alphaproteobacteria bacterium]
MMNFFRATLFSFCMALPASVNAMAPAANIEFVRRYFALAGCLISNNAHGGTAANMEYVLKTVDICNERVGIAPTSYGDGAFATNDWANNIAVRDAARLIVLPSRGLAPILTFKYTGNLNPFDARGRIFDYSPDGQTVTCNSTALGGDPMSGVLKACQVYFYDHTGTETYGLLSSENTVFTMPKCTEYPCSFNVRGINGDNSVLDTTVTLVGHRQGIISKNTYLPLHFKFTHQTDPFDARGNFADVMGRGAGVPCNMANFGADPMSGVQKACWARAQDPITGEWHYGRAALENVQIPMPDCIEYPCDIPVTHYNGVARAGVIRFTDVRTGFFVPLQP